MSKINFKTCPDCGCRGHFNKCPNKCVTHATMNTNVGMSQMAVDIAKEHVKCGKDVMFVPLKLDGKIVGQCHVYSDGKVFAELTEDNAVEKINNRIHNTDCSMSIAKPKKCGHCGAGECSERIMMESMSRPAIYRAMGHYKCRECGKRQVVHLVGPGNPDEGGTHPTYGNGKCGGIGELTDCISSIDCPECREHCRNNGLSNDWIEGEWKKQDEWGRK